MEMQELYRSNRDTKVILVILESDGDQSDRVIKEHQTDGDGRETPTEMGSPKSL